MGTGRSVTRLLIAAVLAAGAAPARDAAAVADVAAHIGRATAATPSAFADLPAGYDANAGQFDASVRFVARAAGKAAWIRDGEAVVQLGWDSATRRAGGMVTMRYGGRAPVGADLLPGRANYFLGDDAGRWCAGVPSYASVRAAEIAPGVDLVWRGTKAALAYDLVVAPGADAQAAAIELAGCASLAVDDATGDLLVTTERGAVLRQTRPICLQTTAAGRRAWPGRFVVEGSTVRFDPGAYDRARELVIDPTFEGGAFIGGTGVDAANSVAFGPTNDVYLTGTTGSAAFPLVNPLQSVNQGAVDGFVIRISADGTAVVYSTFFGGTGAETPEAIAVGPSGDAYVVGETRSANFPLLGAAFPTAPGGVSDAFVLRLAAAGNALVNSTYLGGLGEDHAMGVALDATGATYVAGFTSSSQFPTGPGRQTTYGGQTYDGFVSKFNAAASQLTYSSYHGGSGVDMVLDCAVDAAGALVVTGSTTSSDLPTNNALQPALAGPPLTATDAFVAKYNAAGTSLVFGTYLGGAGADTGLDVALDAAGAVYVCGSTGGSFPTASPWQATHAGGATDAFAAKISASGASLAASTYLGGASIESAQAIVPDGAGGFYVCGHTASSNFPVLSALQGTYLGGASDQFVVRFGTAAATPLYSTFWGGNDRDECTSAAVDGNGSLVFCGLTYSANHPTKGPIATLYAGLGDAAVTRLNPSVPSVPAALDATLVNGVLARLTWTDTASGELGFEIDRKVGTGAFTRYAALTSNATTYDDAALLPLTLYTYRVRSVSAEGGSAWSNEDGVTSGGSVPPPPAPAAPNALEAVVVSATEVDLTWGDRSSDETRFEIQRSDGAASPASIGSVAPDVTTFADVAAPAGWPVTYRVRALATQGPSVFSQPVTVVTPATLAVATRGGLVTDAAKPLKDKLAWTAEITTAGALTDPVASGLRLQTGPTAAPVVVTIRPNDAGWKTKGAKFTWKSAKGALPKVTVVVDGAKRTVSVAASGFDFAFAATTQFRALVASGAASGGSTETWAAGRKAGTFAPPKR